MAPLRCIKHIIPSAWTQIYLHTYIFTLYDGLAAAQTCVSEDKMNLKFLIRRRDCQQIIKHALRSNSSLEHY